MYALSTRHVSKLLLRCVEGMIFHLVGSACEAGLTCAQAFEEPGKGRVLVVDGGGSKRCALLGDNIAEMAHKNGWSVSSVDLVALSQQPLKQTVVTSNLR